jgi:hypothetical protein
MSATPDIDSIRTDTEELEAATLGALAAMDGTDEQEQKEAFHRLHQILTITADWTNQQRLISDRYLAERGRVEDGDLEAVLDALKEWSRDSGRAA